MKSVSVQKRFDHVMDSASAESVRGQDCWIMLIHKLPTHPSPPKLAIFWSTPWPLEDYVSRYREIVDLVRKGYSDIGAALDEVRIEARAREEYDERYGEFSHPGGLTPNFLAARRIHFDGVGLRVWPHEFSVMTNEEMHRYIIVEGAYILVPEGAGGAAATARLIMGATLDTDQRFVRDAALVDGCDDQQALLVALGHDVVEPTAFEPLGWYKLMHPAAIEAYCEPWEAKENRQTQEERNEEGRRGQVNGAEGRGDLEDSAHPQGEPDRQDRPHLVARARRRRVARRGNRRG